MQGINAHRLSREPLEKLFADTWAKANRNDKILEYILDRLQSNRGGYPPSEVEQEVAATVIQWLGSSVGQGFLQDCMKYQEYHSRKGS